jgi:isopentenyl-diphosphate delta-isomerase
MDVILVNEEDEPIGTMEKMEVHQKGLLHRAFSVFTFNEKGEMLLQKRAAGKYHSPGLWTNACCSHPQPGSEIISAATRRLQEEMGFTTSLEKAFHFIYKATLDNGLTEYEFDHVLLGNYDGPIIPNAEEVEDYRYLSLTEIKNLLQSNPSDYTPWFKIAIPKIEEHLAGQNLNRHSSTSFH